MAARNRRLTKEANAIAKNKYVRHIIRSAGPVDADADILTWEALINGTAGTPYEGGLYHLSIKFPENYPYDPPQIRFLTKIYHSHLKEGRDIVLNIMRENWSPHFKLETLLCSIAECMSTGHSQYEPLAPSIAVEMHQNMQRFLRTAVEWNCQYAMGESLHVRGLEALKYGQTLYTTDSIAIMVSECIEEYYGIECSNLLAACICAFYEPFPNYEPWMEHCRELKKRGYDRSVSLKRDHDWNQRMSVRIEIEGTGDTTFALKVSPHQRVLALKKHLKMEYGIDVSGRELEYHGFLLQDYDVLGDRGNADEKSLIFRSPLSVQNQQ